MGYDTGEVEAQEMKAQEVEAQEEVAVSLSLEGVGEAWVQFCARLRVWA